MSYFTRAEVFVVISLALAFLAFVEAVVTGVLGISGREAAARRIDRWCRVIVPLAFAMALVMVFGI